MKKMTTIGFLGAFDNRRWPLFKQPTELVLDWMFVHRQNINVLVEYKSLPWYRLNCRITAHQTDICGIDYIPWRGWNGIFPKQQGCRQIEAALVDYHLIDRLVSDGHDYLRHVKRGTLREVGSIDSVIKNSEYIIFCDIKYGRRWSLIRDICRLRHIPLYDVDEISEVIKGSNNEASYT